MGKTELPNNRTIFLINSFISLFQGGLFAWAGYFIVVILRLPEVVYLAFLIGFVQIQGATDTQKIQNDIFDLKEYIKSKL